MNWAAFPGGDLVSEGLVDLAAGRVTPASALVSIGAPRLARLGIAASGEHYRARVESALDALANHIEKYLDVDGLLALAR